MKAAPSDYEVERAAENRADCTSCGMSDAECTRRVLRRQRSCCGLCYSTDTHPPQDAPPAAGLTDYGFRWANVEVTRAFETTRGRTTTRCVFVASQRQRVEVYVTEATGQIRVFRNGKELL